MSQIGETELDTRALMRALWRKAWLLVLLAAAAAAGTYYGLGFVEPLYTADASILIEERESPLTRARDEPPVSSTTFDESAIQSQVEVLRSRQIADLVIDRLNMTRRPEFDPATRPSPVSALKVMLGLETSPTDASIRQRVMANYYDRLTVFPVQKSRVIAVEFTAPRPDLAAEVANAVAEAFVDLQQDAKRESALAATSWLEQEIERLRDRVAEAEQAIADYRSGNELYDVGRDSAGGAENTLSTQQLSELNAELARARAARAEAEARAQLVQSSLGPGGSLENSQEVLDSPLIQRLRERQVALRTDIAELSTTYLPGHPRIRALQDQLGNIEGQIRQEAQKILAALNTAARVAAAREESLLTSLDTAKQAVSQSNDQSIELRALEREAAAQRELLESFLARYREAVARTDADYLPADARIISRAVEPRSPSFPKKGMMAVAAALATFILVSALILIREFATGRAFRVIGYGPGGAVPGYPGDPSVWPHSGGSPVPAPRLIGSNVPAAPSAASAAAPIAAGAAAATAAPAAEPSAPSGAPDAIVLPAAATDPEAPKPDAPSTAAAVPAAAALAGAGAMAAADATPSAAADPDRPGTAELGAIIASEAVRVVLFAGADGGEGAGDIAFAAARRAADGKLRLVLIDLGRRPSASLGSGERPGLGDLLDGEAAFGEVIRREEGSRVHVIPMGGMERQPPLQRLQIVIGALTHSYDKVVLVADAISDWPEAHLKPDFAAVVCAPDLSETARSAAYDAALAKGAGSVVIVRYTPDEGRAADLPESAAA